MKKMYSVAAILCCMLFILSGCAENKLKLAVKSANKQCPISMGGVGSVESIDYEDGVVVFNYLMNEQYVNIAALKEHPEQVKRSAQMLFSNPEGDMKELVDLLIEANADFKMVWRGDKSGEEVSVVLTAEELKDLSDEEVGDAEKLQSVIDATNMQLPLKIDYATTLKKVEIQGENVVYIYEVAEDVVSLDGMESSKDEMKKNTLNSIQYLDNTQKTIYKMVMDAGKNMVHHYCGSNSGKTTEIVITNGELKEVLD